MTTTTESFLTTYQLARLLGTSRSTILRYEDAGLLEPADVADDANASRLYDCYAVLKLKAFLFHKKIHTDTLTTYKDLSEFMDAERCIAWLRDKRNLIDRELRKLISLSGSTESLHDIPWECPPVSYLRVFLDKTCESDCLDHALAKGISILAKNKAVLKIDRPLSVEIDQASFMNAQTEDDIEMISVIFLCEHIPEGLRSTEEYEVRHSEMCTRLVVNSAGTIKDTQQRIIDELSEHSLKMRDGMPIYGFISAYNNEQGSGFYPASYLLVVEDM